MRRPDDEPLPRWRERSSGDGSGDGKLTAVVSPERPPPYFLRYLDGVLAGRDRSELRVLDAGCGRGDTVAWLLAEGWDAHGVDISVDYLEHGRDYLRRNDQDPDRLRHVDADGCYPFADGHFDVVLSNQVLEHVADLDAFAGEVARVTALGGVGLHNFPARWRPVEGHMKTPLVHWTPKGRPRRVALQLALRLGLAAPYWREHSHQDRVEIFWRYSQEETFYRSLREIRGTLSRHGLSTDPVQGSVDKVEHYRPGWPAPVVRVVAVAFRHLQTVVLHTHRVV